MKIFSDSRWAVMVGVATLVILAQSHTEAAVTYVASGGVNVPPGSLIMSGPQSSRPAGTYSKSVTEIIGMLDAKVDAGVVVAYLKTANVPYQPEAVELIALKEHGATADVQLALLSRSAELREQYSQYLQTAQAQAVAAQSAAAARAAAVAVAAPTYADAQPVAYPAYPTDDYAYPASYNAPYPTYSYSYGYWPSFGVNWCWNNGRWCWNGNRNFGRYNNGVRWNGNRGNGGHWNSGFNVGVGLRTTSRAAFAPVRSSPVIHSSGGGRSGSGGMHFASNAGGRR